MQLLLTMSWGMLNLKCTVHIIASRAFSSSLLCTFSADEPGASTEAVEDPPSLL
jgi:hypothetical protein